MAQIRARWSANWAPPRETAVATNFRLVMTDSAGEEFSLERATLDAAGGTSWRLVTQFHADDLDAKALARAGLTQSVLAGMLQQLVGKG